MHLTWNGHSCFTLKTQQGTLVLDPYRPGSVPGLPDLRLNADGVYCSHGHDDHAGAELVTLSGKGHTVQVEELETYHDPEQGTLRGKNTIRIFTAEGLRVAHLGDLGCELTPEQMGRLTGLDALLFPVGGLLHHRRQAPPFTGASIQRFSSRMTSPLNLPAPGRCQAVYIMFPFSTAMCFC